MDYTILEKAARTPDGLFLYDPAEIEVFQSLLERDLIKGSLHRPRLEAPYAVVHCLTPDGRAFLALRDYVARVSSPAPLSSS
ncbi:MAG: hypothetical protein EOO32_00260 [Comamonadaceae bacterium]|nr:MAG: hypothetical protein EOO32_00260 [Comamonadaceae bacterium]